MRRLSALLALALFVTACGDDGGSLASSTTTTTESTTTTTAPTATTTTTTATTTTVAPVVGDDDLPPGEPYSQYLLTTNAAGSIEVEVPVEWFDIYDGVFTIQETEVGVALAASPDHDGLVGGFTTPGVFIGATSDPTVTAELIFSTKDFSNVCTPGERAPYDDGEYAGEFQTWYDCAGSESDFVVIVAEPYAGGVLALVEITLVTTADNEALDRILASWRITGDV